MLYQILIYVTTAVLSSLGGFVVYFVRKHFKRLEEYAESSEERRMQKDLLVLKSLKAIGELCHANATAIKKGECNGETDRAKQDFEKVDKELSTFLMESTVSKINKGKGVK